MGGKGAGKRRKGAAQSRMQQQQQAAARRAPTASRPGRSGPAERSVTTVNAPVLSGPGTAAVARHYLDVSVVRIQDWLGRTPDLMFRRGASVLLSEATDPEEWKANLPAGVEWNSEAGSVDGVVSLAFAVGEGAPTAISGAVLATDPAAVLADAARHVAGRMREMMPHCYIQAVAGTGDSYAAAYPAMARARRDGDLLIDSPPAPAELFLAKPCDQCRAAAATRPGIRVNDRDLRDLCDECEMRLPTAGRTNGRPAQAPLPERRLREALAAQGMHVADLGGTLDEVAAAGQRDRDDAGTQVALIYADGNQVGEFISRAAVTPGGPPKAEIAPLLTAATLGALAQAVIDRFAGWPEPPVVVSIAGGDDLLVSVPAADAWLFTRTLLTSFTGLLTREAGSWHAARVSIPTLSAGLVFHHSTKPISEVVRLAEAQLKEAKSRARGQAAVAFLDLTADGGEPPPGRLPVTLTYLDEHAERLRQIAALPASHRHALLDLHRKGDVPGFIKRLTDFDDRPLWEIAAGARAEAPAVRDILADSQDKRDEIRRALDIARHWCTAARAPGDESGNINGEGQGLRGTREREAS